MNGVNRTTGTMENVVDDSVLCDTLLSQKGFLQQTKVNDPVSEPSSSKSGTTEDAVLKQLASALEAALDLTGGKEQRFSIPRILTLRELSQFLPQIANNIHRAIGSQQYEITYQRCLRVDLETAGLMVELEVVLPLKYKGVTVGTRRADLIVKTKTNERALIELKAVRNGLSPKDMKQLQFYMVHYGVNRGYLINFPHDDGFSDCDPAFQFDCRILSGDVEESSLHAPRLRLRNSEKDVQVVEVNMRVLKGEQLERATRKFENENLHEKVWGRKQGGEPCEICMRQQKYCWMHKDQKP